MNPQALADFHERHPPQHVVFDGVPWEYFAGGRGPRGLLVLGSELSFGDNSHRLITLFEDRFRVLAPTLPPVTRVAELLGGLSKLLDHEGLAEVHVFGNALGAGLAHVLVRREPGRFDRVALSNFGLCTALHTMELRAEAAAFRLLPFAALRQHHERIFERLAKDAGPERSEELKAWAKRILSRHTRETAMARFELQVDLFSHAEAHQLHAPVERPGRVLLLLANDDHAFSRDEQHALVQSYPGAAVSRYLNGGQWIGLVRAQEFERKLALHFERPGRGERAVHPVALTPPRPRRLMPEQELTWERNPLDAKIRPLI